MTIILNNVSKKYGEKIALENFKVEIEWGKCYAFVGSEGTGKSTALKIFMGVEKPDSGKVDRMGDYKYPTLHSAYVAQECQLNLKKNAVWNVKKARKWSSQSRAVEELSKFIAPERINIPTEELNDAERRIVEIVKASFVAADFIVLDEPFLGMDEELKKRVIEYILDFRGSRPLLIASREEAGLDFAKIIHM